MALWGDVVGSGIRKMEWGIWDEVGMGTWATWRKFGHILVNTELQKCLHRNFTKVVCFEGVFAEVQKNYTAKHDVQ